MQRSLQSPSVLLVALVGAMLAVLTMAFGPMQSAKATHVVPVLTPGNANCPVGQTELKIEPVVDGTFSDGVLTVTIDVRDTSAGEVFDWNSNIGVSTVIAKGGDDSNVYTYAPPATSDTGLHAPLNPSGMWADLSHISFCYIPPPPGEPLTISKTVVATSDFTYTWTINKDVDKTSVTGEFPADATFNYTVTVGHDAGTPSDWALGGTITVTNPNDFDVTADVTDTLDDGSACTVTGGAGAVIPANDSLALAYTCAVTDGSATKNTATVTWEDQGLLEAGSDSTDENVTWTVDTIDECVDVTDTFDGVEVDLGDGTLCVGEDANPTVFNYSHTVPIPQFGCVTYTNTAVFTTNDSGTTDSSSETVEVCSAFEGCTPGYWKQSQHFDSWVATGLDPDDTVASAGFLNTGRQSTSLEDALSLKGGNTLQGARDILLRAAVAALLNESHPGINYGYDGDVVADVNAALLTGNRATILALAAELDAANNAGCPLN